MKEICLNCGRKVLVDDEDYDRLSHFKWYVVQPRGSDYLAVERTLYRNGDNVIRSSMARELLGLTPEDPRMAYHKDKNYFNCQKENLVAVDRSYVGLHRKLYGNNTSGHKGVYYNRRNHTFVACIYHRKKTFYLGQFKTAEEAGAAYKIARANILLTEYEQLDSEEL